MADSTFDSPAVASGQRMSQTNQSAAATDCKTCNGERFVLVGLRAPTQSAWMRQHGIKPAAHPIEEWAACPDCHSVDATFRRGSDGRLVVQMDPAVVRQRMKAAPLAGAGRVGEIPEWVYVWNFARRIRSPRNLVPFPQQRGEVADNLLMSREEYEQLRQEWLDKGSPKASVDELVAV